MSDAQLHYILVDADYRVCPHQRKRGRRTIDYRYALKLDTQAIGTTTFGRTVRTALAAAGVDDLITFARRDHKLTWPLSVYEVYGDRDLEATWSSGLRNLHGINVTREIPTSALFGPRGPWVVHLIEKLYCTGESPLLSSARAKKMKADAQVVEQGATEFTQAQANIHHAAEAVGLVDEMYLANQLASRVAGQSTGVLGTSPDGRPFTDLGCAAAAAVVRDHISEIDYEHLTKPLTRALRDSR